MQRNRQARGSHMRDYGWTHDKYGFMSRREVIERDDRKVGIDYFTGPGGVVLPLSTTPTKVGIGRAPRRPWTSGPPIIRPRGLVPTKVVSLRSLTPAYRAYSALMQQRGSACG